MIVNVPRELQLEITHLCNKRCLLCDHRIRFSDYEYLTKEEYTYLISCIEPGDFDSVQFIGGEPLCHPHFNWLVERVARDFGGHLIKILTNGRLLPQLDACVLERLFISISPYPGFNDDVVAEFRSHSNVIIRPRKCFWNPYRDPNLTDDVAKRVRAVCNVLGNVRVVGTKLYGCCLAEPTERYYHTDPVHVKFTKNWREDWLSLPTWKACQHCFAAINSAGQIEGIPTDADLVWCYENGLCIGERVRNEHPKEKEVGPDGLLTL